MKRICVFCGSNPGAMPDYIREAVQLGHILAERKIGLVYGAGNVGIMNELAEAVLKKNGEVIGVIPEFLVKKNVVHTGLSDLRITGTMYERKAVMAELSDGFIALPGGLGTFEEFFEVLTHAQLGLHEKPCGLLNICGYYDPLIEFLNHAVSQQFIRKEHVSMILTDKDPSALLGKLESWQAPKIGKWMKESEK